MMETSDDIKTHNATVLSNLQEGDVVEFRRPYYLHYGVYVGNDEIVHVTSDDGSNSSNKVNSCYFFSISGQSFDNARVKKESFWTVTDTCKAKIANKDEKRSPLQKHEIVENAESKIGRVGYNVIFNNCEHFAYWCRYGVEESEQVQVALAVGLGLIFFGMGIIFLLRRKKQKKAIEQ